AAFERQMAEYRGFMTELDAIDRDRLQGMDRVNYDTVEFVAETALEGARFEYGARGFPPAHVLNQLSSAAINLPDFLDNQHVIETSDDAAAYLQRVRAVAVVLDQETERAREDAARGATPPDFVIDKALQQLRGMRATPAAEATLAAS